MHTKVTESEIHVRYSETKECYKILTIRTTEHLFLADVQKPEEPALNWIQLLRMVCSLHEMG